MKVGHYFKLKMVYTFLKFWKCRDNQPKHLGSRDWFNVPHSHMVEIFYL